MPQTITYTVLSVEDQSLFLSLLYSLFADHTVTGGTVFVCDTSGSAFAITLPDPEAFKSRLLVFKNIGTNDLTLTTPAGTIDGSVSLVIQQQYSSVSLVSDGMDWWIV